MNYREPRLHYCFYEKGDTHVQVFEGSDEAFCGLADFVSYAGPSEWVFKVCACKGDCVITEEADMPKMKDVSDLKRRLGLNRDGESEDMTQHDMDMPYRRGSKDNYSAEWKAKAQRWWALTRIAANLLSDSEIEEIRILSVSLEKELRKVAPWAAVLFDNVSAFFPSEESHKKGGS